RMPAGPVVAKPRRSDRVPAARNGVLYERRQSRPVLFPADTRWSRHQWREAARKLRGLPGSRPESTRAPGTSRARPLGAFRPVLPGRTRESDGRPRRLELQGSGFEYYARTDAASGRVSDGQSLLFLGQRRAPRGRLDELDAARGVASSELVLTFRMDSFLKIAIRSTRFAASP